MSSDTSGERPYEVRCPRTLELGGCRFVVRAPAEAFAVIESFFVGALGNGLPAGQTADFEIERHGDGWRLATGEKTVVDRAALGPLALCLEREAGTVVLDSLVDRIGFHAGCVEVGGAAVLVAGRPDQGKSSSTVQLLEMGYGFLCEEIAPYRPSSGCVEPYPQSVAITSDFVDELRRSFSLAGELYELYGVERRYLPQRVVSEPVPVGAILLPRFSREAEPSLEPIAAEDALVEILEYCFEPRMEPDSFLAGLVDLLERVPIRRMSYDHSSTARALLARLVAEV